MKRVLFPTCRFFAFIALIMTVGFTANAQNCSITVDKMCAAFNKMSIEVKKCQSIEAFDEIDFDNAMESVDFDSVPDACLSYVLTTSDKTKLRIAFNNFVDTVANKTFDFGEGYISREFINSQFDPMRRQFEKVLKESYDFEDLADGMSAMDF